MSGIDPCQVHRERPKVLDKILQRTIWTVLCDKVQVLGVLACTEVLDGKVVAREHAQGITLSEHGIDLTISGDMSLIDRFHGKVFVLAFGVEDLAEGNFSIKFF